MAVAQEVFKKFGEADGLQMKMDQLPRALRRYGLNPTAEQIAFIGKKYVPYVCVCVCVCEGLP